MYNIHCIYKHSNLVCTKVDESVDVSKHLHTDSESDLIPQLNPLQLNDFYIRINRIHNYESYLFVSRFSFNLVLIYGLI